jgi:hypothetical protein
VVDLPKTLGSCPSHVHHRPCRPFGRSNPPPRSCFFFCLEMHLWPPSSWGLVVPKSNAEVDARESFMLPAVPQFPSSPAPHFSTPSAVHDLLTPHISGSVRSMDLRTSPCQRRDESGCQGIGCQVGARLRLYHDERHAENGGRRGVEWENGTQRGLQTSLPLPPYGI